LKISDCNLGVTYAVECYVSLKITNLAAHDSDPMTYINIAIETLIVLGGGADAQTLDTGLVAARTEHDLYTLEIARLLEIMPGPNADLPTSTIMLTA
jgi:hypothetical protein